VEVSLHELDDHISFLNDHAGDVGQLETTVMNNVSDIETLKTNIPSLPLSATQVNYTDVNNYTTKLDIYLKDTDIFKIQAGTDLNALAQELQNLTIPELPLTGTQVNYTNTDTDVKTVQVRLCEIDDFLNGNISGLTLPISAEQVNYRNADNEVKTVQVRLLEIDNEHKNDNDFDPSEIIQQISDISGNISDITEKLVIQ
jgi:hypothetical protein